MRKGAVVFLNTIIKEMATNGGDRKGVAVQMHAYIGTPPAEPDNSTLRVKDGKQIEAKNNSTGETLGLLLDHVYEQATEEEMMERSLQSLVSTCVEGVNVSVLAIGSAKTQKSKILFSALAEQSLAAAVFQSLLDTLKNKVAALSNNSSISAANSKISRKNQIPSAVTFSLQISFAEFYEGTITDLLTPINNITKQELLIEDDPALGKTIKNLTQSPPLTSHLDFSRLLNTGLSARRNSKGLYGNSSEFSSAVLRMTIKQTFEFRESSTQELSSFFDFVDLPATDRLGRSGSIVRLSEGPLLNKSLFALQEVVQSLINNNEDELTVRYQASQLTTLLQDALGGNGLTFALMCLTPGDFAGCATTLHFGKLLPRICTFPVVNNDLFRGLRRHQQFVQKQSRSATLIAAMDGNQGLAEYEYRLHNVEGQLAQNRLERRILRQDKDALTAQIGDLRTKFRELFDNELALRTELLVCEQEKLAISKDFVALQLTHDTQVQKFESDKFAAETKLLKAEQMVVEIQQDDAKKAAQIQDLCVKMKEFVAEKTRLGDELAVLQKTAKSAELARETDAKKNQQLGLELIVAVNQKRKLQSEMETFASQLETQLTECKQLRSENEDLRVQMTGFEVKVEGLRKDLMRRELEQERTEVAVKKEQLETQEADTKCNSTLQLLNEELKTQRSTFASAKLSLELQLERLQHDLTRETREKEQKVIAWSAKNVQNEELMVALERSRYDSQAQVESFRLKLALLHQSSSKERFNGEVGIQILRELLESYQKREKELRDDLNSARNINLHLNRRLRATSEQPQNEENYTDNGEIELLRARFAALEQQLAAEMEQRSKQALALIEIEAQNYNLVQRQQENGADLEQKIEEKRRLNTTASQVQKTVSSLVDFNELETLRAAKIQLELRLANNKNHWIKLLEQVERRCAELLTKNVMLSEDNENLRQYLTNGLGTKFK